MLIGYPRGDKPAPNVLRPEAEIFGDCNQIRRIVVPKGVFGEGGWLLFVRRLAPVVAKGGFCGSIAVIENAGGENRSGRDGEIVSSDVIAMVSGCAQVIAGVIAPEASALSDIVT
jgi:hypothetical protein